MLMELWRILLADVIKRLSLLNDAARAMTSIMDPDALLDHILELTTQVFGFDACAILLAEPDDGPLVIRRARGYDPEVVKTFRGKSGEGVTGRAYAEAKPVLVNDVTDDDGYVAGVRGAVSEVAVPLRLNSEVIGVLDAESQARLDLGAADLELICAFASHAAIAVNNARLHQQLADRTADLERQIQRQSLVRQAGKAVRSSLGQRHLLRRILELAREALAFDSCAVLLADEEKQGLVVTAGVGYGRDVDGLIFPFGKGITGAVLASGIGEVVSDVNLDDRYIDGMAGGRCEMAAPLTVNGDVIGVLDAEAHQAAAFDDEDLDLFQIFASDVAVAIRNARQFAELERANQVLSDNMVEIKRMNVELSIYAEQISQTNEDLQKRVRELRTLYEASQTITSSLDLNETLETIVNMTRVIINASSSAIRLLDDESEELRSKGGTEKVAGGAQLTTPLMIGDRTIGFFEMGKEHGEFNDGEKRMLSTLAGQAAIAIENSRLFDHTQRTYYETIRALAEALEARDSYTRGHSERVTRYALAIAEQMQMSPEELRIIEHAGLLHDIGKIGISDTILNKPTALSAQDRKTIEHHPIFGDTILGPIKFLSQVQTVVKHHHERYDGTGYPDELAGVDIPLAARIVCVADSYDAMTSDRPYRSALDRPTAVAELLRHKSTQFDPKVVDVFVGLLEARFPERTAPKEGDA
jgi:putative nucleotidyltransferase with HDIG domain